MDDLLIELRKLTDCDQEIFAILADHCAGMPQTSRSPGVIDFVAPNGPPEPCLSVRYKGNRLTSICPVNILTDSGSRARLIDKARNDLDPIHGADVVSRYLFSQLPLKGTFNWRNRLRLRPMSPDASIGTGRDWFSAVQFADGIGHSSHGPPYPFLLEVKANKSLNPLIEVNRRLRELDTYQHALTLLLSDHINYAEWPSSPIWVALRGERPEPEYNLVHSGFGDPQGSQHPDFPDCTSNPAPRYVGDDYYDRLWFKDDQLVVPTSLENHLDLIDQLAGETRRRFRRACYLYSLAVQHRTVEAISVPAFSAAIECLLPNTKNVACAECGKPRGPGPTKLFQRHLDRYGQVSEELKVPAAALYDARSALIHGRHASATDVDFFSFARDNDWRGLLLKIIAKKSLIGWLEDRNRETWCK